MTQGAAESELEQADEFNGQFTMCTAKSRSQIGRLLLWMILLFRLYGVTKLLKGLNPSKALGPDEIHPRVLKELASE